MKKLNAFIAFFPVVFVAFLVAALQPFGISPDFENYNSFFDTARQDFGFGIDTRFEPGFVFLAGVLSKVMSENVVVYGILVVLCLTIKLYVINRFSLPDRRKSGYYVFLAVAFYLFRFFPLHELTQLRAALSVAAIFLTLLFLWGGERLKAIGFVVVAATLHYSSLMITPLLFVSRLSRRTVIIVSIVGALLLYVASQAVVSVAGVYFAVFQTYEFGFAEDMPNPLSPVFFPEFYLIAVSLIFWKDLTEVMRRIAVLQLLAFAIFYGLIDFSVVAVRGRELFSVLWTLYIVQASGASARVRYLLHVFVAASVALSIYLYFILNFFSK